MYTCNAPSIHWIMAIKKTMSAIQNVHHCTLFRSSLQNCRIPRGSCSSKVSLIMRSRSRKYENFSRLRSSARRCPPAPALGSRCSFFCRFLNHCRLECGSKIESVFLISSNSPSGKISLFVIGYNRETSSRLENLLLEVLVQIKDRNVVEDSHVCNSFVIVSNR